MTTQLVFPAVDGNKQQRETVAKSMPTTLNTAFIAEFYKHKKKMLCYTQEPTGRHTLLQYTPCFSCIHNNDIQVMYHFTHIAIAVRKHMVSVLIEFSFFSWTLDSSGRDLPKEKPDKHYRQ